MLYFIQIECYLLFYQQTYYFYYFCIIFYHTNLNNEMLRGLNFVSSGRPQQLIESLKQPQFKAIFFSYHKIFVPSIYIVNENFVFSLSN